MSDLSLVSLQSTHFGSYEANRPGFEKLYRVLSDEAWDRSFDLIKHMTKRGGKMNFNYRETDNLAEVIVILQQLHFFSESWKLLLMVIFFI